MVISSCSNAALIFGLIKSIKINNIYYIDVMFLNNKGKNK
jgi:hypothetical protein|tara:strand:+ start:198 stop:317 length:120 start_codon:yes stop_codon:yes gene_type:complete